MERPRVVVANVPDLNIEDSQFELQSCYKILFQPITPGKGKNILIPLSFKSTTKFDILSNNEGKVNQRKNWYFSFESTEFLQ